MHPFVQITRWDMTARQWGTNSTARIVDAVKAIAAIGLADMVVSDIGAKRYTWLMWLRVFHR